MTLEEHRWYDVVKEELLQQGDLIDSCPVIIPISPIENGEVDLDIHKYNVVIMSQSCDLEPRKNGKAKLDFVLVCRVDPLSEFGKREKFYKSSKAKERLRRGYQPSYHLLNKCDIDGFERDFLVVDFRNVYSVPFKNLTDLAKETGKRLRLLPPYKEHLSQSFARYFMRVGLPADIPEFSKSI